MKCYTLIVLIFFSCASAGPSPQVNPGTDSALQLVNCVIPQPPAGNDSALGQKIVVFAKTLLGTPYKFASSDPNVGFDCSGFITYVFNHFCITVPRSSVDFTDKGKEIKPAQCRAGDLILFTGTDSKNPAVGHIGIIVSNDGQNISFIHSTSGTEYSVTITPLNDYYMSRFIKIIRII